MNRLAPWLLAALALSGCAKNTARPTARMAGPQGVAVYRGYGTDQPGVLRPLVAVANTLGNDLRIVDAVSDQVLLAPTRVAALSVPTEPRPSLIAAGPLHDQASDGTALPRADLLVVAPLGQVPRPAPAPTGTFGAMIQSITTWEDATRVGASVDLGALLPDATLTSLLVVPVPQPDGAGGWRATPGLARVLAGTTDGTLVSIEASRDAVTEAIHLAAPVAQPLGFTILDLAVSPDGRRVYAGTLDPIPGAGGVLGVAEFDNTAPAGAMPVRALSARVGTTQVAAIDVAPFLANDPAAPELDTFGPAVPRVFAVLDPGACGPDRAMPCGIAAIDPVAGGLAPDPAGELPFQAPIQVPGVVVDLAVHGPPAASEKPGLLKFDPGSGVRWTNAIAAATSSAGQVYLIDLAHFALGDANTPLTGVSQVRVVSSLGQLPSSASGSIGIWSRPPSGAGAPTVGFDTQAAPGIVVTPGYTQSEVFNIAWQQILPGLVGRQAVAHVVSGAPSWIAIQEATGLTGAGTSPWRRVARLYDPRLAVRLGDLVQVHGFPAGSCPGGSFDLEVTGFLPPDQILYPGGALAVAAGPTQTSAACLPQGADSTVTVSVRASGLLLTGSVIGYAGRPEVVLTSPETAAPFELRYEDEATLHCPIMLEDPQAWPPASADVTACQADQAACRAACERLVLARKARRSHYVTDACPPSSTAAGQACQDRWVTSFGLQLPVPKGPALSFKVGITDPAGGKVLQRDAALFFTTANGVVPTTRAPTPGVTGTGSTAPYGVTLFDRSAMTGSAGDAIHGYAAFADNLILDFAPWSAQATSVTLR